MNATSEIFHRRADAGGLIITTVVQPDNGRVIIGGLTAPIIRTVKGAVRFESYFERAVAPGTPRSRNENGIATGNLAVERCRNITKRVHFRSESPKEI